MARKGKNLRVFLTGGAGFFGAAVTRQLIAAGLHVGLLLRPGGNRSRIANVLSHVDLIEADLLDVARTQAGVSQFEPDAVIHLAWRGVQNHDRNSDTQLENVAASIALFQSARAAGCQRFIGLGSQAEYGIHDGAINESAAQNPVSLYGASKVAVSVMLRQLAMRDDVLFTWLRLFALYGPEQDTTWFIPATIRALLEGRRAALTEGTQRVDYLYVDDAAAAVLALLKSDQYGVFNLGSGTAVMIRDVATRLRDLIDPGAALGFGEIATNATQAADVEADIAALVAATGWRPEVPLEEGLRRTVDYYRANVPSDFLQDVGV